MYRPMDLVFNGRGRLRLPERVMMAFLPEIERVWLLSELPEMPQPVLVLSITQGYVRSSVARDAGLGAKFRLRQSIDGNGRATWTQTRKTGRGMVREEEEIFLTHDQFKTLWPLTRGRRIEKTRSCVQAQAGRHGVWEVDEFHGIELVMAEIEIHTPSTHVELPAWLECVAVKEVTDDGRFRNSALARDGPPR